MTDPTTSDAALKAVKFLYAKFGYVVVCLVPNEKSKMPKDRLLSDYANVPLFGWYLRVIAQTRVVDFVKQTDALFENRLLNSAAKPPEEGSRFFRCKLELDDDIPF